MTLVNVTQHKVMSKFSQINRAVSRGIVESRTSTWMRLRGICRIDYIIMNDIPYIIEINTIPGLSEESIIPQQLKSAKVKLDDIFEICLLNTK